MATHKLMKKNTDGEPEWTGRWQTRFWYTDPQTGKRDQKSKNTRTKTEGEDWEREQRGKVDRGLQISGTASKITVGQWCEHWLEGYAYRDSSYVSARTHVRRIQRDLDHVRLNALRPSMVRKWITAMQHEKVAPNYIRILHGRLAEILTDAVDDGLIGTNPCSRKTAPPHGKPREFLPTTKQVWALFDAMPDHLQHAVLLGAYAGLRIGEICGLRGSDIDFIRSTITPASQRNGKPLKSEASRQTIPVARSAINDIAAYVVDTDGPVVCNHYGRAISETKLSEAFRAARKKAKLPNEMTAHSLRHYFGSLLATQGGDPASVCKAMRHSSADITYRVYVHLWHDRDDVTRDIVEKVYGRDDSNAAADEG